MPPESTTNVPAPILSNQEGSFAWRVLRERHPALLEQVRDAHPYGAEQQRHLDQLLGEITDGVIQPLAAPAADANLWNAWGADFFGRSWYDVPFLWAESYFYRRLLEAVDYFVPGAWYRIDPFARLKAAELRALKPVPHATDGQGLLLAAVWGNQADLGFKITAALDGHPTGAADNVSTSAGMVRDDSEHIWDQLRGTTPGRVVIVADNAGRELTADLLLIDHLLTCGLADSVSLHVKPYPYYVSDAMTYDVISCLRALHESGPDGRATAQRLKHAAAHDTVSITTHRFYCAPLPFHDLALDLADDFASATLVVLKGDLNYRRLVGDCHWPATTDFASAVEYFPGPVAALRTLKSDVIVGLEAQAVSFLDSTSPGWRTAGTHALIQTRL